MAESTYIQAIGRRKSAIAQVRVYEGGSGKVTVNGKDYKEFFKTPQQLDTVLESLKAVGKDATADVTVRVVGGGLIGQADAIRLGISRALVKMDENLRITLKTEGFLTRDPRRKERKKFGRRGARRSPQWRKR
jgi:small subunit ribosomal protein S9